MRITLDLDEDMIERACKLTGIKETEALVRAGIEALMTRAGAERLAALGGTQKSLARIPPPTEWVAGVSAAIHPRGALRTRATASCQPR